MGASVLEKKMHYPVMTERQLAARWKISLKTLRRWRSDNEGPTWHKLFQYVRYHEADILGFERPAILNLSSRRSGHRLWPLCQARDHEFDQCGPAGKVAVGGERAHVLKQALAAGDELT